MANAGQQPLPVSKLPAITAAQISDDDLLLVTDIDGGSKTSRKMTMKQLVQYVCKQIEKQPSLIQQCVQNIAEEVFEDNIEEGVIAAVKANNEVVEDLLDGVEDGQFLIDCKGAGELEPEEQGE